MASVGLVVISHSRTLAEGVAELAREMGVGKVRVEPAGGDAAGGMGTSIDLVGAAVRKVDTGDGVVLLADIGSSVLTARTLVEDADGALVLADAPLVEGAVAAACTAAYGADLATVRSAAEDAYQHRKT
jgi:phosphoenolpyruvate---glycerone phosphotransferase subunit DhaM